jgi:hypothetical protein
LTEAPERREESDQLPEEAPPEQVVEDTSEEGRDGARESAGGAGDEKRATGHPGDA